MAILFQTLDSNGNPDDGITLPESLAITDFSLDSLKGKPDDFSTTLNSNESITPGDKKAVSSSDAIEHFYENELPGTWFVDNAEQLITLTIDSNLGRDDGVRYIVAEYDKKPNSENILGTGIETGIVDVLSSGQVILDNLGKQENTRDIKSCPRAYGEQYEGDSETPIASTGTTLKLVGDKLELSLPSCGTDPATTIVLSRHKPTKGTMVGTWLDYALLNSEGNAVTGRVLRADDSEATSVMANQFNLDDLVQIYFADKVLFIVLDCDGSKCGEDEKNGLAYTNYTFDTTKNEVTLGDVIVDTISVNILNKVIVKGEKLKFSASTDNDTRRIGVEGEGDNAENYPSDRLLSKQDIEGGFRIPTDSTKRLSQKL